jgi:hypothetical protein
MPSLKSTQMLLIFLTKKKEHHDRNKALDLVTITDEWFDQH